MYSPHPGLLAAGLVSVAVVYLHEGPAPAPREAPEPAHSVWEQVEPVFEPNRGQAAEDTLFVSTIGPQVEFVRDGARFRLPAAGSHGVITLDLELVGARPDVRLRGEEPRPGRSHYYRGDAESQRVTQVPHYGRVL